MSYIRKIFICTWYSTYDILHIIWGKNQRRLSQKSKNDAWKLCWSFYPRQKWQSLWLNWTFMVVNPVFFQYKTIYWNKSFSPRQVSERKCREKLYWFCRKSNLCIFCARKNLYFEILWCIIFVPLTIKRPLKS